MVAVKRLDADLVSRGACPEALTWVRAQKHIGSGWGWAAAWSRCERPDWMLWIAARRGVDARALVRCAAACARTALPHAGAGRAVCLEAIEAAEAWAADPTPANLERCRANAAANAAAAGDFAARLAEWLEAKAKWDAGERPDWLSKPDEATFDDMEGGRPDPSDWMPQWSEAEATHMQMYEDTSEGTPISPVWSADDPAGLARWLVSNRVSMFGGGVGTYEQWLRITVGAQQASERGRQ